MKTHYSYKFHYIRWIYNVLLRLKFSRFPLVSLKYSSLISILSSAGKNMQARHAKDDVAWLHTLQKITHNVFSIIFAEITFRHIADVGWTASTLNLIRLEAVLVGVHIFTAPERAHANIHKSHLRCLSERRSCVRASEFRGSFG